MNIVIKNANNGEEMYFVLNNNHRFSEISSLPNEVINYIQYVYTTKDIVKYAESNYPAHKIVVFKKMHECFKKAGRASEDVIIYVEYGMLGHIINWLEKLIPFDEEIRRA